MSTVTPQIATDTWTVFSREVKPLARDPFQVVFSMIQPLVFLGLFAPLLPDTGRVRRCSGSSRASSRCPA